MNRYYPEGHLFSSDENTKILNSPSLLKQAFENSAILEARALVCTPEHDIIVDIPHAKAIIRREKGALGIAEGLTRDIAILSKVGKPICFVIERICETAEGFTYELSRVVAQQRCMDDYISYLNRGDVIPAKVTHLEPFGAFVDIGCGIPSLIPIDAISVSRIAHPNDRFYNGQNIFAVVKDLIDGRVFLSHKELLGTWEENVDRFEVGSTVPGIVRSIESYGIFIEIAPNLAGLSEPHSGVFPGQRVSVNIKAIKPEKMKLKLAIVDVPGDFASVTAFDYFITEGNISRWEYSPAGCLKQVISDFT